MGKLSFVSQDSRLLPSNGLQWIWFVKRYQPCYPAKDIP